MDQFEVLRAMQSLEDVPDGPVHWLADHTEPVEFSAGSQLIIEGNLDRDCYFIVSGMTEVVRGGEVLGRTGPGEPEGEMGMFFRSPRVGTTTAIEAVTALRLRAVDFDRFAAEQPDEAKAFQRGVMRHLGRRFGVSGPTDSSAPASER